MKVVAELGKGALMAKADIESAFRLLPIHPEDFCLIGMKIGDLLFVDKSLPMGASCSPAHFETFSTFVEWVVKLESNSENVVHYCDDFLLCGTSDESSKLSCKKVVDCFEKNLQEFWYSLSSGKISGAHHETGIFGIRD